MEELHYEFGEGHSEAQHSHVCFNNRTVSLNYPICMVQRTPILLEIKELKQENRFFNLIQ